MDKNGKTILNGRYEIIRRLAMAVWPKSFWPTTSFWTVM